MSAERLRQSSRIENGRLYTVTEIDLPGVAPSDVHRAVFDEPWTWWQGGRISKRHTTDEGKLSFVLWPVWLRSPARVGIVMAPPEQKTRTDDDGAEHTVDVYPASFFADFDGPGSYETIHRDDGVTVRSVWNGVAPRGFTRTMPLSMLLNVHLGAEAGTLSFPFRSGTGFPGLASYLGV